jgi:para-nitrobenzyl esterase
MKQCVNPESRQIPGAAGRIFDIRRHGVPSARPVRWMRPQHPAESRGLVLRCLVLLLAAGCALELPPSVLAATTAPEPLARIGSGSLSGAPSPYDHRINTFTGIPFAAPPVGRLRWRPPEPVKPWSGTRQAREPGPPCWQPLVPEASIYSRGHIEPTEDCLYLNLWAPAGAENLPVLVWFHGGGNETGHASSLIFDGTRLAGKGAIVVTANYRLGAFGFFAHPALTAESPEHSSGNYGLLDQLAVLRWVRDNIAAFGGDRDRVVIFGQSAGSIDVCLLMTSKLARGLMSGVIGFSAGCLQVDTPLAQAEAEGVRLSAGFADASLPALRAHPAADFARRAEITGISAPGPIVDGWVIPEPPRQRFRARRHNRVPLIVGDMADEFRGLAENQPPLSGSEYEAAVREGFPTIADDLLAAYAELAERSPTEAFHKISTHSFFTWQSRTWARLVSDQGDPAWVYHFTHPTLVFNLYIPERVDVPPPGAPRGLGAYHSGDLAYHFDNLSLVGLGWEDWDFKLADLLSSYWVNFAASGDPNGAGVPHWPAYQRDRDRVQEFGTNRVWPTTHPQQARLDLFDRAYPAQSDNAGNR